MKGFKCFCLTSIGELECQSNTLANSYIEAVIVSQVKFPGSFACFRNGELGEMSF